MQIWNVTWIVSSVSYWSLSQHFYWRLNECLIHRYGVAYSRASKQGSTSSRGVGVGHDPGIPWLWQVLHHPEQELVSGRGSFVADGWLSVSVGSFQILLPTSALVPAASPIIPSLRSFGTLCHGYLLLPFIT